MSALGVSEFLCVTFRQSISTDFTPVTSGIEGAMRNVAARFFAPSMAQSQRRTVSAYTRLSALLFGDLGECRLQKLLYEPGAKRLSASLIEHRFAPSQSQYDRLASYINRTGFSETVHMFQRSVAAPSTGLTLPIIVLSAVVGR